jgi:protein tyrosine/serine phosphatase
MKLNSSIKVWLRRLLGAGLVSLAVVGSYAGYLIYRGNLHPIFPGQAYRSAQMSAQMLAETIKLHGIKSVINLRGANADSEWYRAELKMCEILNVEHVDRRFSARRDATDEQMTDLVNLLRKTPKPVLLHCKAGSDRTGLAAALYQLEIAGRPEAEAAGELTIWYGHIPYLPTREQAMDRSFHRYVSNRAASAQLTLQTNLAAR